MKFYHVAIEDYWCWLVFLLFAGGLICGLLELSFFHGKTEKYHGGPCFTTATEKEHGPDKFSGFSVEVPRPVTIPNMKVIQVEYEGQTYTIK